MLKGFAIAQAHAHVAKSRIQISSREEQPMVEMWSHKEYEDCLKKNLMLLQFDTLLRCCYVDAERPKFPPNLMTTVVMVSSIAELSL